MTTKTKLATAALLCIVGACTPAAQSALNVIAPLAVDAITMLVRDRWGADAEVDRATAACIPAPPSAADWFGDDDDHDFEYATCRGKAVQ